MSFARMLVCAHEREPFGAPMCAHLQTCREPWIKYVKWYIGSGFDTELLCVPCAERREQSLPTEVATVCEECFEYATTEVCDLVRAGGQPETRIRPEPFNSALRETALPTELGTIVDIAPVDQSQQSIWLLLADGGQIFRLDADSGECAQVAGSTVPLEPQQKPFAGHVRKRRLHASNRGDFVAVVNDYGCSGQVIELQSGKVTISLDGGDYHPETVPFSFAFADVNGRVIAIHRTAWNRLDFSDSATGELLSVRGPTSYRSGQERPEHYLDYFHGALYVSPSGTHILDDGWVWHPVGTPTCWSLARWLTDNVWESEDGPTRKDVCAREYYWDHGMVWLDDTRIVIGGIGDDDIEIVAGARIFDVTSEGKASPHWRSDWPWAGELIAFAGPAGRFFSDGISLFSSCESGLSRWDPGDGARTGQLQDFYPSHHHRGAGELVQLIDGGIVRWPIGE